MENSYPLDWVEEIIQVNLNPPAESVKELPQPELEKLLRRLKEEHWAVERLIARQILGLSKRSRISVLVLEHYKAAVNLMDIAYAASESINEQLGAQWQQLYKAIMYFFKNLLKGMERRFREYLCENRPMPKVKLAPKSESVNSALITEMTRLEEMGYEASQLGILSRAICERLEMRPGKTSMSYREVAYLELLVEKLSTVGPNIIREISPLDEVLLSLNFNHRDYIQHFIHLQGTVLTQYGSYLEKARYIRSVQNIYKRIVIYPEVQFEQGFAPVNDLLTVWFSSEIVYCETMGAADVIPVAQAERQHLLDQIKVVLDLTTDQISILVRGAYDLKYLIAKSVSAAFRGIIPFISSRDKTNISWNSTRTKSYDPERRDIDVVIAFLYKLIDKIREY